MRLKSYINETSTEALKYAKKATEFTMKHLFNRLQKYNFEVPSSIELIEDLNVSSYPNIQFEPGNNKGAIGKYISGAVFDPTEDKPILHIEIRPKAYEYFKRFKNLKKHKIFMDLKKNAFAREMFDALTHEVVHSYQFKKSDGIEGSYGEDYLDVDWISYQENKGEIEAFAAEAAVQKSSYGKSWIYDAYQKWYKQGNINPKSYQRFIKHFEKFKKELKNMGM